MINACRNILIGLLVLISFTCYGQNAGPIDTVIIGELRKGSKGERFVAYNEVDQAKFRPTDAKFGITAELFPKENYYDDEKEGTEIRFKINGGFSKAKKIDFFGELYTYLASRKTGKPEKIVGRFRDMLTIDLQKCDPIGINTYKLREAVKIRAPEKFSLASMINYLNKLLYNEPGPIFYQLQVGEILSFDIENDNPNRKFIERCYKLYDLINPYLEIGGYYSNERRELSKHIKGLEKEIDQYSRGLGGTNESLDSLERDLFESRLVADEYLILVEKLKRLNSKLEELLFGTLPSDTKQLGKGRCEKNIDFRIGTSISFGNNAVLDRFSLEFMSDSLNRIVKNQDLSDFSFSIVGMTLIYPKKRRSINPGLVIGAGANFQGREVNLGAFLGGAIAFQKSRSIVLSIGASLLPVEQLNSSFEEKENQLISSVFTDEMITDLGYGWSPFIALSYAFSQKKSSREGNVLRR